MQITIFRSHISHTFAYLVVSETHFSAKRKMKGYSEYVARSDMHLNKETFKRETHKVSLSIDGQEHVLVQGMEECNDFFQNGKAARLVNK